VVNCDHANAIYFSPLDRFGHAASGNNEPEAIVTVEMGNDWRFFAELEVWSGIDSTITDAVEILRKTGESMRILDGMLSLRSMWTGLMVGADHAANISQD
jgi:hypothetical protein